MRIVIHGQQAFGRAVLEKLLARGAIRIKRVRAKDGKIPAPEYAAHNALAVGDKLG